MSKLPLKSQNTDKSLIPNIHHVIRGRQLPLRSNGLNYHHGLTQNWDTKHGEVIEMPRLFGWFNDSLSLLSCLDDIQNVGIVSLLLRESREHVVVVGPLSHELNLYPFLDLSHQIRLLGLARPWAEKYAHVIEKGGIVICIDMPLESFPCDGFKSYQVRDPKLVPTLGPEITPTALAGMDRSGTENDPGAVSRVDTRVHSMPDF